MANHISHFEIFASDVERARRFYERVFSWRFESGGPPGFYFIFTGPQVLGLDNLARELILLLCGAPQPSKRGARHAHALAMLDEILPEAKPESFSLPRPRHERARQLADHFATQPNDSRPVEIVAGEIGGASLRTFERRGGRRRGLSRHETHRQRHCDCSVRGR